MDEYMEMIRQSFILGMVLMVINAIAAVGYRFYLNTLVLPKKQYFRRYQPTGKQWVDFITPAQNNEFKGLVVLSIVILLGGYLLKRLPMAAGLMIIVLSLSLYTFLAGLIRPEYILTEEGLVVLNVFPPYMNRNMGFYPWKSFQDVESKDTVVLVTGKRTLPLICQEKEAKEVSRYIKRHLKGRRVDSEGK